MLIKDIIGYLEERFPKSNASDLDKERIGLIIGDENIEVSNILLSLDLNLNVVEEAINLDANFIVIHHPYLFDPLYNIHFSSDKGKVIRKLYEHNISIYSMHTNYDVGIGGVNDSLIELLGLSNINTIDPKNLKDNFLRYGEIENISLVDFVFKVKEVFKLNGVRVVGDINKSINKVGIIGGSGGSIADINNALNNKLDCYITGEIKLNVAQYALEKNIALIEVNHGIEKFAFYKLQNDLKKDINFKGEFFVSIINTDPLEFI